MSLTLVAALALSAGCARQDFRVSLAEPERREALAQVGRGKSLVLQASNGRTIEADWAIEVTDGAGKQQRLRRTVAIGPAVLDSPAPVVLVLRPPERTPPVKKKVGPFIAMAGLGITIIGVILVFGAVGVAGPANDTTPWLKAGGVVFGVGTGVSVIGGFVTLGESNPRSMSSTWETVDLGAVRVVR